MKRNNKKEHHNSTIVQLDEVRALKKSSILQVLRDSRKAAQAIATHTCLICNTKKMCVDKKGVCASCYDTALTPEEKKIADDEAKHKTIKVIVTDDRWEG